MSNLITRYLNQNISWKRVISSNVYNENTTSDSTIKGRLEDGFKLVRNAKGEEVVSSGFLMTESPIVVDDLIEGRIVIASKPVRGLNGSVLWYEVFLK